MSQGTVFDIKRYAIHDGPGIRVTVFFKGCPLGCWWCHNPEGRSPERQVMARPKAVSGGCSQETVGRVLTTEELMAEILKDEIFLDESGGGVTISGGEPLMQPAFARSVLERCKEYGLETALDTTGYAAPEVIDSVAELVDVFLFDLKLMDEAEHEKYTGALNTCILRNFQALVAKGRRIVVRFPLIPGITNTPHNLNQMADFVKSVGGVRDVHVLPYHRSASDKYRRLNMLNRMEGIEPPTEGQIAAARHAFEQRGLNVLIGG